MPSNKPPDSPGMQGLFDFDLPRAAGEVVPRGAATQPKRAEPVTLDEEPDAPPLEILERPERAEPKAYAVSEIVRAAARTLEARYGLVTVEGEVSNFRGMIGAGHLYFTLKDAEAQLSCVMFKREAARLKFAMKDGMQVRARGRLSIYEGQGKFQMYADALEPAGQGLAQIAFEQLKQKLHAEGLFDPARKRPLPKWPRRVGLVTSATGAAIKDVLRIAERRGRVRFLLSPCMVQGDTAPFDILRALKLVERHVDVIIVGRGGGSAEDLSAFNDEKLARAIAACGVPVVSAVGHEVDFTIADFVADHRAPTPSAAAELVVPLWADAHGRLREHDARVFRAGKRALGEARQRLQQAEERAGAAMRQQVAKKRRLLEEHQRKLAGLHPRARLDADRRTLHALEQRLVARLRRELELRKREFASAAGKLGALSPLSVLERGYSITRDAQGHVVARGRDVKTGDTVKVRLSRGELDCRVESISDEDDA